MSKVYSPNPFRVPELPYPEHVADSDRTVSGKADDKIFRFLLHLFFHAFLMSRP